MEDMEKEGVWGKQGERERVCLFVVVGFFLCVSMSVYVDTVCVCVCEADREQSQFLPSSRSEAIL